MSRRSLDLDGLQGLLWSFGPHRVLTVASRTGILARLARGAATPEVVAGELGLEPLPTGKVLRALCAIGVLTAEGETFRVAPELVHWFAPGPADLAPFLDHSHQMYERWGENLEGWLRGEPWTVASRGPEGTRRFGEAMQALGGQFARRLADLLDARGARRMLDVGGGFGHFSKALCRANPGLCATVLDTPAVVDLVAQAAPEADLAGRVEHVAGDYLESEYETGYDLVLLANVLHQESPERASALVRKGAAALVPGGRLVVVDFSIDEDRRESVVGAIFAINMRSFGDVYPEPTLRGWMQSAGLTAIDCVDLGPHRWMLTGSRS